MANPEHLAILKQGAEVWNRWREENPDARPELRGAYFGKSPLRQADFDLELSDFNLSEADLFGADFFGAVLARANLSGANLKRASFFGAVLPEARLRGADLQAADLRSAVLTRADLSLARLNFANLVGPDLASANLAGSSARGTVFAGIDLRSVNGLKEIKHSGPSHISSSTLATSHGRISESFLKGCGLQDWEIEAAKLYAPGLSTGEITDIEYEVFRLRTTRAVLVNSLFLSYSHDDADFVDALGAKLDELGIRFWRDVHDMTAGRMETQIDRAMRLHPVVLLVLSKHSVVSDWVEWEAKKARELERDLRAKSTPKDVLLPVALDDAWKTCDWPEWLRQQIEHYYVATFEGWENPTVMERQFEKVTAGLPLYGPKAGPEEAD